MAVINTVNKQLIQKHFSQAAGTYDQYATIQKTMAQELLRSIEELNLMTTSKSILEIGCGTGYFTQLMIQALRKHKIAMLPEIIITDISGEMLQACQKNISSILSANNSVHFMQADGEIISLASPVDIIVSNATFQWFQDLDKSLACLRKNLHQNGWLFFTTFGESTFQELHHSFKYVLGEGWHLGQKFISGLELENMMVANNFKDCKIIKDYHRQYFPGVQDFFTSIKKVGASNACLPCHGKNNYIGKKHYREILNYYQNNYQTNQGVYCTYEVLYCYGRRE